MNPNGHLDPPAPQSVSGKSKKNKKKKGKSSSTKTNGDHHVSNEKEPHHELDNTASDDELDSPAADDGARIATSFTTAVPESSQTSLFATGLNGHRDSLDEATATDFVDQPMSSENTPFQRADAPGESAAMSHDTEWRLENAAKERDQLRLEVTELRKSLEEVQKRHDDEIARLKTDSDSTKSSTEQRHAEEIHDLQERLEKVQLETQEQHRDEVARAQAQLAEVRSLSEREREEEAARLQGELAETQIKLQEQLQEERASLERLHREAEVEFQRTREYKFNDLKTQAEEAQDIARQQHDDEIATLRAQFEDKESDTQRSHAEEISRLEDELERTKAENRLQFNEEIVKLKAQFQATHSSTEAQHEQATSTLRAQLAEVNQQREQEIAVLKQELGNAQSTILEQREEIGAIRSQLLEAQSTAHQQHDEDNAELKTQLEEAKTGKEHWESQYHKLLGKVNSIKAQLGERLKADAAELARARDQIEGLEERNRLTNDEIQSLQSQVAQISTEREQQEYDISTIRSRSNLSQQNWAKERDDLLTREAQIREEFESAKQAMQDWEVLAMEERSVREGLGDRVGELEDQLSTQREAYERASSERDAQSATVDGLQRALREIQEARKVELREIVENTQNQLEEVRKQLRMAEESSTTAQKELEIARHEMERALPFEKEVKEKNLLIGKLRHEAVILNDHLTKALRFLKKGKTEDTVDRQLVTNHVIQFLALDRADPKKFQVLQLISAILGWTEEQNEAAGLSRPGASSQPMNPNSSLRAPMSPFLRRVSSGGAANSPVNLSSVFNSSPALASTPESAVDSPGGKESLADLWSTFLEREAASKDSGGSSSRRETMTSPTSGTSTPRQYGY